MLPLQGAPPPQIRMMHTLYRALTGSHLASPTWTVVGFQNDDFVTDLRGVGMLGPLQMLMFAQEHQHVSTDPLHCCDHA